MVGRKEETRTNEFGCREKFNSRSEAALLETGIDLAVEAEEPNAERDDRERQTERADFRRLAETLFTSARKCHRLTLERLAPLVKAMKLTSVQIDRIARNIIDELKSQKLIDFKAPEDKVFRRAVELIKGNFDREAQLDREVNKMLDDLERSNPGGFERYKMFPMLKKRLAKEKGIIL